MQIITIQSSTESLIADTLTPVALYLKLRDEFPNAFLLESSEYNQKENSYSYICLQPIASFKAFSKTIEIEYPNQQQSIIDIENDTIADVLQAFTQCFAINGNITTPTTTQGLFGYTQYDAIQLHHPIHLKTLEESIPLMQYQYFQIVILFDHYHNEIQIIENITEGHKSIKNKVLQLIHNKNIPQYHFKITSPFKSNYTDEEFLEIIQKGKTHCFVGDVFQVVLSRKFEIMYQGDEFNVYRQLRSINPSPYLYFFDYLDYKIMGSSPETQITIKNQKAHIYPIAGTFKRTGDSEKDNLLATALLNDTKENAEHVMLVDLARNDLSINGEDVEVIKFKSVEQYSHVMHLVSKVKATITHDTNPIKVFFDTFPAGTLSGAPKHRAMQVIDALEKNNRGFYGGAVGMIGLDGSINHAIMIRSAFIQHQTITFQAGCGVVALSDNKLELQEIYNKVNAVKTAIDLAQNI